MLAELSPKLPPAEQHAKLLSTLRRALVSAEYYKAAEALEFARSFHKGLRKDKVTPEFAHQIYIALSLLTLLPSIRHKEETIIAVLLHDVVEDYNVSREEIEVKFAPLVAEAVWNLSKKRRGEIVPYAIYFAALAKDPIGSLVKGTDRGHNILTMADADWSIEKMQEYLDDLDVWFLPMLKAARMNFPDQTSAYENIKAFLIAQRTHIQRYLDLLKESAPSNPVSLAPA